MSSAVNNSSISCLRLWLKVISCDGTLPVQLWPLHSTTVWAWGWWVNFCGASITSLWGPGTCRTCQDLASITQSELMRQVNDNSKNGEYTLYRPATYTMIHAVTSLCTWGMISLLRCKDLNSAGARGMLRVWWETHQTIEWWLIIKDSKSASE